MAAQRDVQAPPRRVPLLTAQRATTTGGHAATRWGATAARQHLRPPSRATAGHLHGQPPGGSGAPQPGGARLSPAGQSVTAATLVL